MIKQIEDNVKVVGNSTEEVTASISRQEELTIEAKENFDEIKATIDELNASISSIATAVEEQSSATSEIAQSIVSISERAETNKEYVNILIENIEHLLVSLDKSNTYLNKFKLSSQGTYFIKAKIGHIKFLEHIFAVYTGQSNDYNLNDYKTCEFGKFYYSKGIELFGNDVVFKKIEEPHKTIHVKGKEIIDAIKNNQQDVAKERMYELIEVLNSFINDIDKLIEKYI
jgi:methyl-accepting chemotaxis protein